MITLAEAVNPVEHVVNHVFWKLDDGTWIWSSAQTNLVLTMILMLVLGPWVASRIDTGAESEGHDRYVTRNIFAHMVEVICVYLRDKVIEPLLHERTAKFLPFLLALFFFILINNLLGLIPLMDLAHLLNTHWKDSHVSPIGGTATQSIWVTGALALVSGFAINVAGIRELGFGGYIKHLTADAPVFVWPIVIPIEAMGIAIKPVALAIRLFANMTAGHILLATLFGFVAMGVQTSLLLGTTIVGASVIGAIAVSFLELFVAFVQAFVFMFLTAVFISLLSHHHEHEEGHATSPAEHQEEIAEAVAGAALA
ncbi:MAG: F0F1 ATP synthase subunit A [Phycisphaerales bacterium]